MAELQIGKKVPDFKLKDQNGQEHKLSDYKGKKVILYFYPKDDTPGCTTEACNFRDDNALYKKKGAVILGISTDDEKSHKKFAEKYSLPFTLLSDPEKIVVDAYGVWKKKSFMGKEYMGTNRETFVIGEDGKLLKHYDKVDTKTHSKEILDIL
ncbi:MAG TPA: thioredoxin-dependent thiol peroxidase [Alphaproteobacteria bacterium]|nr:thioredoxin-dependent thiol peroxidase [Alphaproteobacteria bacterium]